MALADALQIAPSELTRIPMPAPGNGHTDSAIEGVRRTLVAVDHGQPGGQVLPVDMLRRRVARIQEARRRCRVTDVASDLPVARADAAIGNDTDRAPHVRGVWCNVDAALGELFDATANRVRP